MDTSYLQLLYNCFMKKLFNLLLLLIIGFLFTRGGLNDDVFADIPATTGTATTGDATGGAGGTGAAGAAAGDAGTAAADAAGACAAATAGS